jgi:hypothetical protein
LMPAAEIEPSAFRPLSTEARTSRVPWAMFQRKPFCPRRTN